MEGLLLEINVDADGQGEENISGFILLSETTKLPVIMRYPCNRLKQFKMNNCEKRR